MGAIDYDVKLTMCISFEELLERDIYDTRKAELYCRSVGWYDDADEERQLAEYLSGGVHRSPGHGREGVIHYAIMAGDEDVMGRRYT